MPRANRYIVSGQTYHVTHRCHNGAFLLRFARDRDGYRRMLREKLQESKVGLLSYCITSNHVHLLMHLDEAGQLEDLSRLMQSLEGEFAQSYNQRKDRNGAFWGDRYHATMIDSGEHLWNCLRYIELNMVRAGVVGHPGEWAWTGYQELMGQRKRYRVVDEAALLERVEARSRDEFRDQYEGMIADALSRRALAREAKWTESLAVGSERFVREVGQKIRNRTQVEIVEEATADGSWVVREAQAAYG